MPEPQNNYRSGYVTLLGRPNVGKSTMLNAILRQSVAPVSFRPQTTRRRQLGILTLNEAQVIFVDTPGLHEPHHKLGERMNAYAREALKDVDVVLVVFDAGQPPNEEDRIVADLVKGKSKGVNLLMVLNKIDLLSREKKPQRLDLYQKLLPGVESFEISATHGEGLDELQSRIIESLPFGPRYYPEEEITDLSEGEITADLIRAAAMQHLRKEVPYAIAVRIDEFKERGKSGAYIAATIFVERESQKGIVIGKGGSMLREIGTTARKEVEAMSGRNVFLELRVKVLPKWRNNPGALERMGYRETEDNK